tara:strand:- start:653 stop:1606 length:954 start_codon:yes stop_codon:yes gene_type:complete
MAIVTNTFQTFTAIGNREDLSDIIYNISPTETPFISAIGKEKATGVLHEWQNDTLRAAAANAQVEGDEIAFTAVVPTTRVNNRTQISRTSVIVSGTQDTVNSAGRNNELAYQISKSSKELKRDMEVVLTANQSAAVGGAAAARTSSGLPSWIQTNVNDAANGANGQVGGNDVPGTLRTDGTQRAFTESQLKDVVKQCWDSGGDPSMIMLGSFNKQKLSGFTGGSTKMTQADDKKLVAAIDIYESDFGSMTVVPNRFSRNRDCFVIQPDMWAVAYLRDFQMLDLAVTGDAQKKAMLAEYTLVSKNEAASGAVFSLTAA